MLRHTYVTTMLDAGIDLRDVQIAARHADPRTTMRYDRARNNLDRHANYILAAFMAAGAGKLINTTIEFFRHARSSHWWQRDTPSNVAACARRWLSSDGQD